MAAVAGEEVFHLRFLGLASEGKLQNMMSLANLNGLAEGYAQNAVTRRRLARKHFSPSALPAVETPFYIDAASVSARGNAQCVCMRAPSHRPTRGNMAVFAQAALFQAAARKLLSASCCTQVARHLSSSCSAHVALCKFLSARRSALVSVRKMLSLS